MPAARLVSVLETIAEERGVPLEIVVDNGSEFVSKALDLWAAEHGVTLCLVRPGKPVENCFDESFNGTFRKDRLDAHWLENLGHECRVIESWRLDYNNDRPQLGPGDLAPAEFAALREPPAPFVPQAPKSSSH